METVYWIGVNKSGEIDLYDDIRNLPFIRYWIKASANGRFTKTTSNKYSLYDYEIFDNQKNITIIKDGDFECIAIRDRYYDYFSGRITNFTFRDRSSERTITLSSGQASKIPSENIKNLFSFLDEIKQFSSFKEFDLVEENEKLRKENQELNELK